MYSIFVCLPLKSSGLLCYLEKARVNVLICKKSRVSFAEIEIELCHTINFGVFDFVWNHVVPQQFTLEMFYSFVFFFFNLLNTAFVSFAGIS